MEKLAHFFIDDVIFVMRDLAKERPASLFDNAFMAMLKKAHDEFRQVEDDIVYFEEVAV